MAETETEAGRVTPIGPATVIGRYTVTKKLGQGSMGDVFLGVDESLDRRAAVKLLGPRHLRNETVKERFLREARALARLNHPNLITIYEAGFFGEPARPYFAMELLEGGDCQKLLEERGPLPSGVVALIGAQAAAGLGEAARAGIIHRDVKPANLGISGQGVLKVTDFSLAKSLATEKSLTGKGMVVGTADYIAPEQARGEDLDERADLYSLGCTLFHLLTGKPPFRAEKGTEMQKYIDVMKAHLASPIPDPRKFVSGPDDELCRIIAKMMVKDPHERPSFAEVAPQLMRVAGRLNAELPRVTRAQFTVPSGLVPVTPHVPPPPPPAPTSDPDPGATSDLSAMDARRAPVRSARGFALALIIAALVGGVVAALLFR